MAPADMTSLRLAMHASGYCPVPVLRHDATVKGAGKRPTMTSWQTVCATADETEIRRWHSEQRDCTNTGLLCGSAIGLDLDLPDPALAEQVNALADAMLPRTPLVRIGKAPKSLRVFRGEGIHHKVATPALILPSGIKVQIEALGEGNHFVAFGVHPDTKQPYTWPGLSPLDVPFADLPVLPGATLNAFLAVAEAAMRAAGGRTEKEIKEAQEAAQKPPAGIAAPKKPRVDRSGNFPPTSREEVESALAAVPNCHSWEGWHKIGAAIFDALADDGEDLFRSWSAQSPKDDPAATRAKWESYRTSPASTTEATLFWEARQNGWKSEREKDEANRQDEPPPHPGYDGPDAEAAPAPDPHQAAPGGDSEASGAALRALLSVESWADRDIPEPDRLLGDLLTRGKFRIRVKSGHKVGGRPARARLVISPTIPRLAWPLIFF